MLENETEQRHFSHFFTGFPKQYTYRFLEMNSVYFWISLEKKEKGGGRKLAFPKLLPCIKHTAKCLHRILSFKKHKCKYKAYKISFVRDELESLDKENAIKSYTHTREGGLVF